MNVPLKEKQRTTLILYHGLCSHNASSYGSLILVTDKSTVPEMI